MNKSFIVAAILLIAGALTIHVADRYSPSKISFANGKYAEVPLKVIGGHTYVKTLVNGKKSDWMVDSGWVEAAITDNIAHGLPGVSTCYTDANTRTCTKRYTVKNLQFLDSNGSSAATVAQFKGMGLLAKDKMAKEQGGTLGFWVFRNYVIKFDYQSNKFAVYDPKYFDQNRAEITDGFNLADARAEGHTFRIATKVNGIPVGSLKLDTGSLAIFLSYKASKLKGIDGLRKKTVRKEGLGFGGDYIETDFVKAEVEFSGLKRKLEIGLPSKPMAFTRGTGGDLGYPALKGLALILDYPGQKLYIKG